MNVLAASSLEIGAHPATMLLLGGLIAAVLRGRSASIASGHRPHSWILACVHFRVGKCFPTFPFRL